LVSVDTDPSVQRVAQEFPGQDSRRQLVLEDGPEFPRHEPAGSFDLVFADAMPGKPEGLDECLRVFRQGGFDIIDDMLPQANWPDGHAEKVPMLPGQLAENEGLSIVPLAWASGVVVAVKRLLER
jgi:predicted O-methyltransferase YrrM